LRVRDDRGLGARDALPSQVFLLRGALRLLCDVVPRVRGVLLPCCGALLLSLTFSSPNFILNFTELDLTPPERRLPISAA
jgi:hypothetical protein